MLLFLNEMINYLEYGKEVFFFSAAAAAATATTSRYCCFPKANKNDH